MNQYKVFNNDLQDILDFASRARKLDSKFNSSIYGEVKNYYLIIKTKLSLEELSSIAKSTNSKIE
jgi:hypothetical protein